MIIREALETDFDQVFEIEKDCFFEPYTKEQLMYEFHNNPINKILVAVDNNTVIGFIDYMIAFNSATISQIAVTKEYRKQGIASNLLKEMERTFPKEIDDFVETVTLEVRESNSAAIALYEKNGYEFVVTKKNYYKNGENAAYMIKRLLLCQ